MRKIVYIILALLFSVIMMSCASNSLPMKNSQTEIASKQFSRIIVLENASQNDMLRKYLGDYTDLQKALDLIVNRYNASHGNDDLFNICCILRYLNSFQDQYNLIIEYYSQYFEQIWVDSGFKQNTKEYQNGFATELLAAYYLNGRLSEGLPFFEKYAQAMQDPEEKFYFSEQIFGYYTDAKNPNLKDVAELLAWTKEFKSQSYDQLFDVHKAGILHMIAKYSDMLGDTQTAKEFEDKSKQIIQGLMEDASQQATAS